MKSALNFQTGTRTTSDPREEHLGTREAWGLHIVVRLEGIVRCVLGRRGQGLRARETASLSEGGETAWKTHPSITKSDGAKNYTYRELLNRHVDRSNSFIKKIDRKRTVVHMLDVQNLCLDPNGADYIQSVGGAPSGADTLGPAKRVLERARAEGFPVLWSLWGLQPDGSDAGIGKYKAPSMCSGTPDAPGSHGTWNGQLVKGFDPLPGEHVFQKHRYSSFYGTAFNEYLREHDAEYLVICGSSTGNCVITTAMNGWERNYKVIVLADTGTAIPLYRKGAIPLWESEVPLGYGQHWEALRNIQASYGDVMTHDEFFELIDRSK